MITLCCNVPHEDLFVILGWIKDLGFCAAFSMLLWAPLGRWILNKLGRGHLPDTLSLSISLGMGAWGFAILALGLAGLLYRVSLLVLAVALFIALGLHRQLLSHRALGRKVHAGPLIRIAVFVFTVLSGVFIALVFFSALAPELSFDALNVHLPYARDAAAAHRAGFVPNNWSSVMPALPLMSYITAFLFSGVTLAKLFNFLCYVLCGGVVFGISRRWWGALHASAASILFWGSPVALYEATTALIDLPLTLFSAIAALSLLEWTRNEDRNWLWLSAAALGLAFGCKYHAAFWLIPFLAIILFDALVRRRMGLKSCAGLLSRYALIVALLFLPWLLRAWAYTGNPVFPVANSIFRSPLFPPSMEAAARAMYANEGVGAAIPDLIKLPWTVTFHPGAFRGTLGLLFLPGVVLALVRGRTRQLRFGLLASIFYFFAWAMTAQEIRYLLPLLPLLCVLSTAGFMGEGLGKEDAVADGQGASRRQATKRALLYGGAFLIAGGSVMSLPPIYPLWVREWTYWHGYQSPVPFLLGRQSAEDYLRRDVPSIYVYDYINEHLGPGDRVLLLNDASQFYSRVPTLYSFTVEGEDLLHKTTEAEVLERLRKSRITYVLLNYNGITLLRGVAPRLGVYFFLDKSFQVRHLEPVYSRNNVVLYRVRQ